MAWAKNQVLIIVIFAGNMNNGKYGEGITWKEGSNARRKKGRRPKRGGKRQGKRSGKKADMFLWKAKKKSFSEMNEGKIKRK